MNATHPISGALGINTHGPIIVHLPQPNPTGVAAIASEYKKLGQGVLGYSTTPVETTNGTVDFQDFQHGVIYWSATTGAHAVYGAIDTEYAATAHEKDAYGREVQTLLGLPTSDEMNVTGVTGARMSSFQGGIIYWSPATGAHVVYGAIGAEYAATAHETDANGNNVQQVLGLPTYDEMNVTGVAGARMTTFQHGIIYWSSATGAHVVYGAIGAEYAATGDETDYFGNDVKQILGLPTSDEMNVPGVAGARMNTFQRGTIYWSPATGAHVVYGAIGAEYQGMGGPTSYLGLPTSDEQGIPGGRETFFTNGKILWTPQGGAHAVQAVPEMTFNWNNITFNNGVPVGGWAELTVYADGSYDFSGHFHDSGFPSYNDSLVFGLVSPSGVLYTFAHSGHMAGTIESGSRDDNWNVSGSDPSLAAGWADLEGCQWYGQANTSADWNSLVNQIEQLAGDVASVIQIIA